MKINLGASLLGGKEALVFQVQ